MNKPKILLFTYADEACHDGPSYHELLKLTNPSKEEYCATHGYDFLCKKENILKDKKVGWERINMMLEYIDKYDYLFYTECDSIIMNHTIRLENLIDNNYDITVSLSSIDRAAAEYEINAGIFLIKCSEWSKDFFTKIYKKEQFYHHDWAEQAAIIDELKNNPETRKHFRFVNNRFFNSYHHSWYMNDTDHYKHGDFILHLAGRSNESRFEIFNEAKDHVIKASDYKISFKP